jgi:hypothetical protein
LHTQHIVEFGLPLMTLYQVVFLQGSDLGLVIRGDPLGVA